MPIRVIGDTSVDFIGKRRFAFAFSGALVLLGLVAFVMISLGHANLGIQFQGGTLVEGFFDQPVDVGQIRTALQSGGFADAEILEITGRREANFYLIRVKADPVEGTHKAQSIIDVIKQYFPDNAFHMDSVHEVGPSVGKTLQTQTRWAVIISLLGILIYITVRFDFRFGIAATIATFHDVLAVLGIAYALNMEVTILLVSSLLTLAGYSLTDTVIVYDRIRENLKK
ncbi:MAG: protein translocase subunit SecF, partial [candidate division Zixibacteria bacterium]|nr:protein translocase subunit SecF [candidate division Zixibacteria bacterium]